MSIGRASLTAMLLCALVCAPLRGAGAGELRRGLGPEPDSLHIHRAQGLAAINLLRDLREGLVTFDAAGNLVPGVAAGWQVLDEGRRYVFTLRADARWSNGDAVTAADFVRAWRQALTPGTAAVTAGLLQQVRNAPQVLSGQLPAAELGIEALAPDRLQISLTQAAPWMLEILAHPVSFPLHPSLGEEARQDPVNGAYQISEWTPRALIRLRRNPQFHAAAAAALETIEYFPIEEPNTELARYRADELDITETIPAGRYDWLRGNLPADLRISPYLGSFWLGLNMQHRDLGRSVELRRALALAIDRQTLVRVVLGAGELPAYGVVPPGMSDYQPRQMALAAASQAEREAAARKLLAAAGYGHQRPLLLQLRYNTSALHRRIAVAVAAMWKQVLGIDTELVNEEWKVFVNNRRLGVVTEVFRGGWIADFADPSSFLDLFRAGSEVNTSFYADAGFEQLMDRARQSSGDNRLALLGQAEERLLDTLPVIPLYYYVSRHLVKPDVGGFVDNIRDIHLSRYLSKGKDGF
jgi:oligopeptide transport system substrate-binding protein